MDSELGAILFHAKPSKMYNAKHRLRRKAALSADQPSNLIAYGYTAFLFVEIKY